MAGTPAATAKTDARAMERFLIDMDFLRKLIGLIEFEKFKNARGAAEGPLAFPEI
jgi:hypothetical protein